MPQLSSRLARLRKMAMARRGSWNPAAHPLLTDVALWRAVQSGQSRVQRRAAFLLELVNLAPINLEPDWRLAGDHLRPEQPRSCQHLSPEEVVSARQALGLTEVEFQTMARTVKAWQGAEEMLPGGFTDVEVGQSTTDSALGRGYWSTQDHVSKVFWSGGWIENHSIRDYPKVLRLGFSGIRTEIEEQLAQANLSDPDFPQKENFWRAALSVCDAGIRLGQRYAEEANRLAGETTGKERERLLGLAERCRQVPARGARTFAEAVQSLWFSHILTCGEDGINANSLGRLDQVLFPYYQAEGLSREEALEWLEELACRLYLDYDVQAITLGGVDASGHCAVNELSYLMLEATRNVDFIRDVSIRINRDTPLEFLALSAELIAEGGGIPFLFNDDCFVPALTDRGIALEDARDYAPIGCIELTIPGKANPHAVSGWFNSTKCLELALFDGRDPRTGEQLGPHTGNLSGHADFEAFWRAYTRQVEFFAQRMVYHCNRGELMQRERGPLPCWSTLTDACIPRGRDITNGGALYNYHSICLLGTANTADSLMAVKKLVFEEKKIEPEALLTALRSNFDGWESLRQTLLRQAPKYGNDAVDVDELARKVDEQFIDLMDTMRSPLGGRYFVHLFSFLCNLHFGKSLGATPDGRLAGEPIAYSLSAQQGRDEKGVTAMLNTLARLPHQRAAGASAAIIELDPKVVEGEAGRKRLVALIQSAISLGIGQLQWNVVTVERLRQAQKDPDHFGNIPVRVAGFSQQFRLVDHDLQEHIIARTKHTR